MNKDKNLVVLGVQDVQSMAESIAKSGLFPDVNTKEKAFALMMLCQAEGLHPMQALKRYNIIQNRPAMKADAMLAEFNSRGGVVKWIQYTEKVVEAEFHHPNGSTIKVKWTLEMAAKIKQTGYANGRKWEKALTEKDNWKNYPRQMLKARVISEGLRAIMPEVCTGVYTPEEEQDFAEPLPQSQKIKKQNDLVMPQEIEEPQGVEDSPEPIDATPVKEDPKPPKDQGAGDIKRKTTELGKRLIELKAKIGEDDFKTVLGKFKGKNNKPCQTPKDIKSIEQAQEIITALEDLDQINDAFAEESNA